MLYLVTPNEFISIVNKAVCKKVLYMILSNPDLVLDPPANEDKEDPNEPDVYYQLSDLAMLSDTEGFKDIKGKIEASTGNEISDEMLVPYAQSEIKTIIDDYYNHISNNIDIEKSMEEMFNDITSSNVDIVSEKPNVSIKIDTFLELF